MGGEITKHSQRVLTGEAGGHSCEQQLGRATRDVEAGLEALGHHCFCQLCCCRHSRQLADWESDCWSGLDVVGVVAVRSLVVVVVVVVASVGFARSPKGLLQMSG